MSDLISKSKLMLALIHCKGLSLKSFEAIIEFLENYPIEVNMDKIKEQIFEKGVIVYVEELIDVLDKGGV